MLVEKNEKFASFVDDLLKNKGYGEYIENISFESDTTFDVINDEYVVECMVVTLDYNKGVEMYKELNKVFDSEYLEMDVDVAYDEYDNPLGNYTYIIVNGNKYYDNLFK